MSLVNDLFFFIVAKFENVWSLKISIPPPKDGFLVQTLPLPWNFQFCFIFSLKNFGFQDLPPPPLEFQMTILGGGYGYFLEPHNMTEWDSDPVTDWKGWAIFNSYPRPNPLFLPQDILHLGWRDFWEEGNCICICCHCAMGHKRPPQSSPAGTVLYGLGMASGQHSFMSMVSSYWIIFKLVLQMIAMDYRWLQNCRSKHRQLWRNTWVP